MGSPRGFTLVAVVVAMAVMAILMEVAVQTVTFQRQREKEEELIFRGQQYVEAVRLFRARQGRFPLTLKELAEVNPRVLRKVWVDPITGKNDWVPVFLGEEGGAGEETGGAAPVPTPSSSGERQSEARGPIIGVRSRSCREAIKLYEGRSRYCDWKFFFDPKKLQGPGMRQPPGKQP
ncbi:MAG: prepilin-type N-terminal cleavage/methylation domain-containing protein [Thermoanaerobaculaceae bacterium]